MFQQFKLTFVLILYTRLCLESHATALDICLICSCRNSRTSIDCSYRGLVSIPQSIPPNVENLDFRGNSIEEIKVEAFRNLSNLTSLDLESNSVKEIKAETFQNLSSLETLYLQYNKIEKIEVKAFDELPSLRTLFLSGNKIKEINADTFRNLFRLAYIYLNYNEIREVKVDTFRNLSSLTYISLSSNKIQEIKADTFRHVTSLTYIDLSDNNITEIKADTFRNLSSLTHLYLRTNGIMEIKSDTFRNLFNLKELYLSSNKIKEIEADTFRDLSSLRHLSLSSNGIKEIEADTFQNLSNLTKLFLSSTDITEIKTDTFRNLSSLTDLNLSGNDIKKIDGEIFRGLSSLTTLNLGAIGLKKIKPEIFKYLSSLKTLHLLENNIMNIQRGNFGYLPNLEKLYLNKNNIKKIQEGSFEGFTRLKHLYLSDNNITYIQRGIFENLPSLQRLFLRNSRIKTYEDGAFLFIPSLNYIDLGGNKDMMCECHLPAVVNYTKKILKKNVYVLGECLTDLGKAIRIMKYMQCQNYSLFQRNMQCQACSGMKCKDPEVTNCTSDEPVCESKFSMNGGTVKYEKSCSTYRKCLEAMKNNTFTCNKRTSNMSCVTCCTGNLCNKNDVIENAEWGLEILLNISQKSVYLKAKDIDLAVDIQEKMVPLILNVPVDITVNNILPSINYMMNTPEEVLLEAGQSERTGKRILDIIEAIAEKIPLKEQQLTAVYSNLGIGAMKVENDSFAGAAYGISFGNKENEAKTMISNSDPQVNDTVDFISLPMSLLKHLKTEERAAVSRISFFALQDDKLYRVIQNKSTKANTKINSHIIAANIPNIQITNLEEPVIISFHLIDQNTNNPQCVYWDESPGQEPSWSTKGCNTSVYVPGEEALCSCNHLTSFALLMDVNQKISHLLYMTSYIGCGIALACLILTVIFHLCYKSLRKLMSSKILVSLCISLAITNFILLVGMHPYALKITADCKTVAALLHYFLLTSFMWTAVEALHIFLRVNDAHQTSFMLKSSVMAWGLPAVIVAITLGVNHTNNYIKIAEVCWLSKTPFYAAFLAPVVVILLFNLTMIVLAIRRLSSEKSENQSEHETKKMRVFGVFSLSFLFVLSWVVAFIAAEEEAEVFHILFIIFNILLGMFIFIFYCICKKDTSDDISQCVSEEKKWINKNTYKKQ